MPSAACLPPPLPLHLPIDPTPALLHPHQNHYRGNITTLASRRHHHRGPDKARYHLKAPTDLVDWAPPYPLLSPSPAAPAPAGSGGAGSVVYTNSDPRPGHYGTERWEFVGGSAEERRLRAWCEAAEGAMAPS